MRPRWFVLAIAGSSAANAASAEPSELSIWYRSSDTCPSPEVFLERLNQLGRDARLAGAGDNIDFVVTLGSDETGSFGRLERQAERGTIAIREVQAPRCKDVAEALALSLDLALDPARAPDAVAAAPPLPAPAPTRAVAPMPASVPPVSVPPAAPEVASVEDRPPAERTAPSDSHTAAGAAVGAQAMLLTGVAPNALFGGAVFGELGLPLGMSARLTGYAGWAVSTVTGAELEQQLFAARLEGCSPRLHWANLTLAGCIGVDGGAVRAVYRSPTGSADSGPWGAATLLGRAGLPVSQAFSVEAQGAVMLPWVRYEVGDPAEAPLARGDVVLVSAGVGASYVF